MRDVLTLSQLMFGLVSARLLRDLCVRVYVCVCVHEYLPFLAKKA